MVHRFDENRVPEVSEVGAKAKALMQAKAAGFNVPDVFVLSGTRSKPRWNGALSWPHRTESPVTDFAK